MRDDSERLTIALHRLEMMLVSELGKIDGCTGIKSIRIKVDKSGDWRPVAIDFGKADGLRCMEMLQAIVPGYQHRYRIKG
jgi:hypothetical protein